MRSKIRIFAAVMFAAAGLCGCGKVNVELDKYVTVSFKGYDSVGSAEYDFDDEQFINDYGGKLKLTKEGKEKTAVLQAAAGLFGQDTSPAALMTAGLEGEFDKSEGLSNGDTVTFSWTFDEAEIEGMFNCDLVYGDISAQVSGLEELEVYDPFEDLKVSFSGTAPEGRVQLSETYDGKLGLAYEWDRNGDLSNGDVVTISAVCDENYLAKNKHMLLSRNSMEVTVEGLPAYISSAEDISDDLMKKMQKQAEDVIASEFNRTIHYYAKISLLNKEYTGNYFLKRKQGDSGSTDNIITLVYRLTAETENGKSADVSYYYAVQFFDLMELADGTQNTDLAYYKTVYNSSGVDSGVNHGMMGNVKFNGYTDLDSLFNRVVVDNLDKYEYEDNSGSPQTSDN